MKKWFKNMLIVLLFLFCTNKANAQNSIAIDYNYYNTWQLSNESCYGCGSFYVMVVNNPNPVNGYYYYDIYFWSNSYYSNGYAANTYIKPVNIYAIGPDGRGTLVLAFTYAVVPPKSVAFNGYFYVGYVYSMSSMQKIKINWSSASAW
jgi:hypothetical protein